LFFSKVYPDLIFVACPELTVLICSLSLAESKLEYVYILLLLVVALIFAIFLYEFSTFYWETDVTLPGAGANLAVVPKVDLFYKEVLNEL